MPEGDNPRWITAAEVAENYQPKNGGGGLGGSIADQQVAFGNGTDIAGSNDLKWDNSNTVLSLSGDLSLDGDFFVNTNVLAVRGIANTVHFGDPDNGAGFSIDLAGGPNTFAFQATTPGGEIDFNVDAAGWLGISGGPLVLYPGATPILSQEGSIWEDGTDHSLYWYDGTNTREIVDMLDDVLQFTPIAAPGSPVEGMEYAGTDHHLHYYNGTDWTQLDFGFDTGWTANADAGDKMKSVQSAAQIDPIAAALDASVSGAGNLLKNVAEKVKALETALRAITLPHA